MVEYLWIVNMFNPIEVSVNHSVNSLVVNCVIIRLYAFEFLALPHCRLTAHLSFNTATWMTDFDDMVDRPTAVAIIWPTTQLN